ncbi:hypothetical protein R3P38DRAFT_1917544 [Favolaschia claudopus]|uniref:Uncharacterized protein n=1 Tax=Favolaschia claudopus TaxID=2862362 RepID=A0AAW0A1H9_9AGAR
MRRGPVLVGNDLFRSTIASVFPLFRRRFPRALGLGPGSALLAQISVALMVLLKYGHVLRQRSKYAYSPRCSCFKTSPSSCSELRCSNYIPLLLSSSTYEVQLKSIDQAW